MVYHEFLLHIFGDDSNVSYLRVYHSNVKNQSECRITFSLPFELSFIRHIFYVKKGLFPTQNSVYLKQSKQVIYTG